MRARVSLALAVLLCLAVVVGADDKKNEADRKAMVGKWTVEKAEIGGKDITVSFKILKFEVREGGKYSTELGDIKDEGTFTADASKNPKQMDITATEGVNKGTTIPAIYKFDGDTLTVCYDLADKPARPEKFESKADTKTFLVTYKRAKK